VALLEAVVTELDDVVADRRGDVGDLDRERAAQVILDLETVVGLLGDARDDLLEHLRRRARGGRYVGIGGPARRRLRAEDGRAGQRTCSKGGQRLATRDHSVPPRSIEARLLPLPRQAEACRARWRMGFPPTGSQSRCDQAAFTSR